MTDGVTIADVVADAHQGGEAVLRLAANAGQFDEAVKAFRARDSEAWRRTLEKADLLPVCHRVCEWLCSKECVRICILLAGQPREPITLEQIGPFTAVLARLAEKPRLLEALAHAVEAEDAGAFRRVAEELKAQAYLHLLCHWVCFIRCHIVCRVLCDRAKWNPADLVAELHESAVAAASIAKNPDQLKRVIDGAARLNCEALKETFGENRNCRLICHWVCSWRCVIVCLRLTAGFPMPGDFSIEEMRAFALFCGELVRDTAGFNALAAAVVGQDEKAFVEIVRRLKAERFVHQLCHWICHLVCRRLCFCVCPPPGIIPIFDHVGVYRVDPFFNDFTAAGTTTAGNYAFTATIPLIGLLPSSPAADPIEYRFTVQKHPGGPVQPLTMNEIGGTEIGSLEFWEWDPTALPAPGQWKLRTTAYTINNAPQFYDIQQDVGAPLPIQVSTPIAADGWVRVPSDDNLVIHGGGKFAPTHVLAMLDTTKLTHEQFDLRGPGTGLPIVAGASVPPGPPDADNKRSRKPVYTINFEARKAMGHAFISGNSLPNIALCNTVYAFDRHPDWAGTTFTLADDYPQALLLDIRELRTGGGCSPITTTMTAEFTAYHPYLGSCHLYLEGPAPVPPAVLPDVNPAIDVNGQAISPAGGLVFNVSKLKPCAYILWIKTTLNLTVGDGAIGGVYDDHIALCIH